MKKLLLSIALFAISFTNAQKIKFECHPEVSNVEEIEKIILKFKQYYVERDGTDVILTKVKIPRIIHQTYN